MIGTTLSHYRITEKLGHGGMGEVYRAEDTNLSRQVAIKVLPDIFAGDPERLARFAREAKLLAWLNHPNIASIYGLEQADGKSFLVLELVEGKTLAERLRRGPLPVEESLEVCRQIAEGLEAAHEKGIIHRDLKPANVKVTPEGKVKILDFGLARALHDKAETGDISHSLTITDDMTCPGFVLGTAAYMSPEQATGKTVDKRTDIWAFGCVMYECLTAERAFRGDTITETVASILKSEPDWTLLPTDTPLSLRAVVRQCVQKDPGRRLHNVADVWVEVDDSLSEYPSPQQVTRQVSRRRLAISVAASLLVGGLITTVLLLYFKPVSSAPVVKSMIRIKEGHWLDGMRRQDEMERPSRTAMALSSDGRFVVYSAIKENPGSQDKPGLYLRRLDQLEARPIPGTEGGISPFLSPDDRWVGFWADGKLSKVSIDGGVPVGLCDAASPYGASWSTDNRVVFSSGRGSGLLEIPAEGGKPEPLTTLDKTKEEYSHRLPHWLPSGKGVLFTVMRGYFDARPRVAVLQPQMRQWRYLLDDAADARYILTGHLVFLRRGVLMAVGFNLNRLELTGRPVPVVDNVMQAVNSIYRENHTSAGQLSISDSGWLIYATGGGLRDIENSLMWVDQRGNTQPVTALKADFFSPRLSPDGGRIAYTNRGREWRIWIYDVNLGTATPLTDEPKSA